MLLHITLIEARLSAKTLTPIEVNSGSLNQLASAQFLRRDHNMALDLLSSTDIEGSMLFTGIPNPKEGILYALEIVLQFVKK